MSLSKQLLILITVIFIIVFSVSFMLSVQNIKSYLEVESEFHVQDTATSLGLSLSPHMSDEQDPILRTMMNAIFDTGYYREMRLVNVDGIDLIHLSNPQKVEGVPQWLIDLFPMKTATAMTEISTGWNIAGTLHISSNPGYGYLKLYQQAMATLKYSFLVLLAAIVLLVVVLRFTLQSLKDIEQQANEISSGQFTQIEKIPWTTEVKNVAKSMNSMSSKIGGMIERLNSKLDSLSENLKRDALTKLLNQATFNVNIKQALSTGKQGYAAFIKFDDLAAISKNLGNKAVDTLLKDFADMLEHLDQRTTAYRLYGSEFSLLCPDFNSTEINLLANQLQQKINEIGSKNNAEDLVHIGFTRFDKSSDFEKLMPAMLESYEQAKLIGQNAFFIKEDSVASMTDLEWKTTIINTIDNNTPEISFTNQAYNYSGEQEVKVMEEAFTSVKDSQLNNLSIGTFLSMAQEFNLVEELDKCIVNKIIDMMERTQHVTPVTINLSMHSVASAEFKDWLKTRLSGISLPAERFVFSVTAYAAAKDLTEFAEFCKFIHTLGATTLLKRYSSDIIAVDRLKELDVDYIRLSRDLTNNVQADSNKPEFLDYMNEVSSLLDIKVLAESVIDDEDFEIVKKSGLFGISR